MLLIGQKIGKLTILGDTGKRVGKGKRILLCCCDCGNLKEIRADHIGKGIYSCGCYYRETHKPIDEKPRRHNHLYQVWCGIKVRCYNTETYNFKKYGAKGIVMCDEWRNSFEAFRKWALANGFEYRQGLTRGERLSIDRINPKGNYEPSNCRWITLSENVSRMNKGRAIL